MRKLIYTLIATTILLVACNASGNKDVEKAKHDSLAKVDSLQKATIITDIDGNVYNTVLIGTQIWLKENLKVTHYRNGDPIPNITDNSQWSTLLTGAYCDCDNTPSNSITYGKLYNWYAVHDSRNIAPTGWHVPTNAEWLILTNYLGGEDIAGGKLKESDTTHWRSPNEGATNSSGFTALPGGFRSISSIGNQQSGSFYNLESMGCWWSSTESNTVNAYSRSILWWQNVTNSYATDKADGNSLRCIKD
jgi:uncharacterized protein (TIGR02145 family)